MGKYTNTLTLLPPLLHALIHTLTLLSAALEGLDTSIDFNSLEGIVTLFKDPTTVFVGWVHYVVFDLLIGRSIVSDSIEREVGVIGHIILIVPCLFFTLMIGPFGWLLYMVISTFLLQGKNTKDKTM